MAPSGTPPPHVTSSSRPGTTRTALLGVAIGLAAFATVAAFGAGAYLLIRSREAPRAHEAPPTPALPPVLVSAPPAAATAAPTSRAMIHLHSVVPRAGVRYRIDGVALDPAVTSIARPAPGTVLLLEAEADGYMRELIRVDDGAPDILDVRLVEQTLARGAQAQPASPPTAGSGSAARADREKKRRPIQPDIPENPF